MIQLQLKLQGCVSVQVKTSVIQTQKCKNNNTHLTTLQIPHGLTKSTFYTSICQFFSLYTLNLYNRDLQAALIVQSG